VTSSPAGIGCGSDCTETYNSGTVVTLTATPSAGSVFSGWSGDCSSCTGSTCPITMDADKTCSANFSLIPVTYDLTITPTPSNGKVTSNPGTINCGSGGNTCTDTFGENTTVTLTATPDNGYSFNGWTGDCSSCTGNTCQITMDADKTCSANFKVVAGGNRPPSKPTLTYPPNNSTNMPTTITFKWQKSTDPDGDPVTYDLYICEDEDFTTGCITQENIAVSFKDKGIYYAGMGIGLLVFGIVIGSSVRIRRKIILPISILIAVVLFISCGGDGGGGGRETEVSYTVNDLKNGTTYYWKVVAEDGKGGETESDTWHFTTTAQ